jgi:hypothetical protein
MVMVGLERKDTKEEEDTEKKIFVWLIKQLFAEKRSSQLT